jgi:hypothetical protein
LNTRNQSPKTEAQFLVERPCPKSKAKWSAANVALLPVAVWVSLPAEAERLDCGGKSFAVYTDRPGETVTGQGLLISADDPGTTAAVCEHMGHLIE